VFSLFISASCSPHTSSNKRGNKADFEKQQESTATKEDPCNAMRFTKLDDPHQTSSDGSTILFNLTQENVDPCSIKGYVVGKSDSLILRDAGNGVYFIPDVPEGEHDVIIQGDEKPEARIDDPQVQVPTDIGGSNLTLNTKPKSLGLRINGIKTELGQQSLIENKNLLPLGHLKGQVFLEGQIKHGGILVNIPGTHWVAFSDNAGNYTVKDIVPGGHFLDFSKDQFFPQRLEQILIQPEHTLDVEDVYLTINHGQFNTILLATETKKC